MADRSIAIHLDREGPFQVGDRIEGRAVFRSDEPVDLGGSTVSLFWRTSGECTVTIGEPRIVRGPAAPVSAGVEHDTPFAFPAPLRPISFRGTYFAIEWFVRATVDVPWAVDPSAERGIEVAPRERPATAISAYRSATLVRRVARGRESAPRASRRRELMVGAAIMAPLSVAVGVMSRVPYFWLIMPLCFGGYLMVRHIVPWARSAAAARKLGSPMVDVPESIARGEQAPIAIELTPRADVHIEEVSATLTCTERAVYESSNRSTRKERVAHEQRLVLTSAEDMTAGTAARWTGVLAIPDDAPPSFITSAAAFTWEVVVHIAVRDWPDSIETYPVEIRA